MSFQTQAVKYSLLASGGHDGLLLVPNNSLFTIGTLCVVSATGQPDRALRIVATQGTNGLLVVDPSSSQVVSLSNYTVARAALVQAPAQTTSVSPGVSQPLVGTSLTIVDGTDASFGVFDASSGTLTATSSVADGASAVGMVIDTTNALANAAALILSVRQAGVEKLSVNKDGLLKALGGLKAGATGTGTASVGLVQPGAATSTLSLIGTVANSGTNVGVIIDNTIALANGTAKALSIQSGGVEVAYFLGNGGLTAGNVSFAAVSGGYFDASNTGVGHALGGLPVVFSAGGGTTVLKSIYPLDQAAAIGTATDTLLAFTNAAAKLHSFRNNGTEKLAVDLDGKHIYASYGDVTNANANAGGNATSNTVTGRGAIASGASACTITNSKVTSTSIVLIQLESTGDSIDSLSVAVSANSFVVTSLAGLGVTTAASAKTKFSWIVMS